MLATVPCCSLCWVAGVFLLPSHSFFFPAHKWCWKDTHHGWMCELGKSFPDQKSLASAEVWTEHLSTARRRMRWTFLHCTRGGRSRGAIMACKILGIHSLGWQWQSAPIKSQGQLSKRLMSQTPLTSVVPTNICLFYFLATSGWKLFL